MSDARDSVYIEAQESLYTAEAQRSAESSSLCNLCGTLRLCGVILPGRPMNLRGLPGSRIDRTECFGYSKYLQDVEAACLFNPLPYFLIFPF